MRIFTLEQAAPARNVLLLAICVFAGFARALSQSSPQIIVEKINDVIEGGTNGKLRIALDAPIAASENISISFVTTGTATLTTDYSLQNVSGTTATIPAGAVETIVEVDAGNDGIIEGPETAGIQLLSASSASGTYTIDAARNSASTVIVDANAASSTPLQVMAGTPAAEPASNGVFTVKLAGVATSAWPVSVAYVLSGTSTPGVDYQAIGNLIIPANTNSIQVSLNVMDDHIIEQDESFTFALLSGSATDGGGNAFIFPPDPANNDITTNISDDDNIPSNQIISIIKTADAAEPATNGTFKISLPGDYVSSAAITIASGQTGTATAGGDYTLNPPVLPAYQNSVNIPVTVIDDAVDEPVETVILSLENSLDGNNTTYTPDITNGTASMNIADDDNPLPLKLISFNGAFQSDGNVILEWQTALEDNTDYFNIQRSLEGNTYTSIKRIDAKGTDNNYYSAVDADPFPVGYYRLQIVDKDQKMQYSDIIRVQNSQQNTRTYLYPNPAKGQVTLKIGNDQLLHTKAIMTNAAGQTKKIIDITEPNQIIYLEQYAAGIYFLKFENGENIKLVIQ